MPASTDLRRAPVGLTEQRDRPAHHGADSSPDVRLTAPTLADQHTTVPAATLTYGSRRRWPTISTSQPGGNAGVQLPAPTANHQHMPASAATLVCGSKRRRSTISTPRRQRQP
ncbi:hypothetical protein [Pseudonocardia zijingensis]|jgi:hypothetical protein|uniref:Uncharacterized protein n=1 Tax=Pseudonocardia zijingensis TaxID=153376 RepID=A0ABP4A0P6_9PSEU